MAENQALLSGRRRAICAGDDVAIRATDAERHGADLDGPLRELRLGDFVQAERVGRPRQDRQSRKTSPLSCHYGYASQRERFPVSRSCGTSALPTH